MADDILIVEGINSRGYGIIPKAVMQDERLSITAKAMYAYFCSFAGAGNQAFPKVDKIRKDLAISKSSYYKHLNLLKDCGYVKTEQRHKDGRLSHNVYTLVNEIQCPKKQDTEKPDTEIQDTVFWDTNIINKSLKINSNNKINRESERARRKWK